MKGKELIELLKPFSGKEIEFLPIENGTKIELWVDGGDKYITTVDAVQDY